MTNKGEKSRGSILAKKHVEALDALLRAYEARLKPSKMLEEKWKRYSNPKHEARQLEIHKLLVKATQTLMEQVNQAKLVEIEPQRTPNKNFTGRNTIKRERL